VGIHTSGHRKAALDLSGALISLRGVGLTITLRELIEDQGGAAFETIQVPCPDYSIGTLSPIAKTVPD
jgi:hypothetical protein